jgi:hypothetical protein
MNEQQKVWVLNVPCLPHPITAYVSKEVALDALAVFLDGFPSDGATWNHRSRIVACVRADGVWDDRDETGFYVTLVEVPIWNEYFVEA